MHLNHSRIRKYRHIKVKNQIAKAWRFSSYLQQSRPSHSERRHTVREIWVTTLMQTVWSEVYNKINEYAHSRILYLQQCDSGKQVDHKEKVNRPGSLFVYHNNNQAITSVSHTVLRLPMNNTIQYQDRKHLSNAIGYLLPNKRSMFGYLTADRESFFFNAYFG